MNRDNAFQACMPSVPSLRALLPGTVSADAVGECRTANVAEFLLSGKEPSWLALFSLDGDYTYADLLSSSTQLCHDLIARGGRKGDRVIVVAENSFFWVVAYLGILRAGMVCVPLPAVIGTADLQNIVQSTEPKCAFLHGRGIAEHDRVFRDAGCETETAVPEPASSGRAVRQRAESLPATSPDDVAALMFTSGSAKRPRGVVVTHGNIIANTNSIISCLRLDEHDRMMTVLPFYYCFGTSLLHTHLRVGGSLVLDNRFLFPEKVLQRMQSTACTGFAGVPSHYQILLRRSSLRHRAFPHLRCVQQAGGHLAPTFIRELREVLPNVEIAVMYGQTEATARLACLPPGMLRSKLGSIGKAIPGVTLRVVLPSGSEVQPGEVGEIVAEGENITCGYWRDPQETAACFRGGKLYTGDLATVDEDGFIYICGRSKDFIKCGGKRVDCRPIEDKLLEFDGVVEVAVIGVADETLGEAVKAFVVPATRHIDGLQLRLRAYCQRSFPSELVPRQISIVQELPKNSAGKVLKPVLRSM